MKNIFKKNQIIITALAIMIVIAGYLSFTNNDKPEKKDTIETTNPDLEDYDDLTAVEGLDVAQATDGTTGDTTTDDTGAADNTAVDPTTTGTDETTGAENAADDANVEDTAAEEENDETTPVDTEEDDADELGDISDKDILEAANDVSDTGELDLEDGVPGEAVLASTTLDSGFFISNKISREQMRAKNREQYMEIIESPDIAEALKTDATNHLIELLDTAEKENATEIALGSRGFEDALVSIHDGKVDVVINAESINDQQLAIIEEEVKKKTEIAVKNMTIVPVVVAE